MATTASRKAFIAKITKNSGEPDINPLNYRTSLIEALNYYNTEFSNKEKKAWFVAKFKKEIKFPIADIHEREFRIAGTLARILSNGNALEETEMARLKAEIARLKTLSDAAKVVVVEEKKEQPKTATIQDRLEEKASEIVAEFNGIIDDYTMDRSAVPDVSTFLKKMQPIATPVAKKVVGKIQSIVAELTEACSGKSKDLVEGYSNFKKVELKRLLGAYESLVEGLEQAKKVIVRKKRTPKAKPAGVVVAKLKFAASNDELKLKSVSPTGIVGADELYCFNVKTRKLQVYKALDGMTLTVKGTTIMNFDMDKSSQKTVRKPETVSGISDKGKRVCANFMKALTAKPNVPNGRINADTILIATFK